MSRIVTLDLDHLIADIEASVNYDIDSGEAFITFDNVQDIILSYQEGDEYL